MINIVDPKSLGYPILSLEGLSVPQPTSCPPCQAFRPAPQPDGYLVVDPEITLPSPGMDVEIAYYYNALATFTNGPFGYDRSISPNKLAQASGSPALVTLTRGNCARVSYQDDGHGNFLAQTPGLFNTLIKDTVNNFWEETTPDGITTAYPLDTAGHVTTVAYIQDAVGNRQTFSYSGGLLSTLKDPAGRLVSFSYSAGLLQTIEDWAGRRTTFAYNTTSASPKNLLTTVTGPTGCQTQYQYATFTLATVTNASGYDWLLSGIVDPNGYGTSYSYDGQMRVLARSVSGVGITTYQYGAGYTQEINALGALTSLTVDSNSAITAITSPLGLLTTYTRNSQMQKLTEQNPLGSVWSYSYDSSGNPTSQTNPLGQITTAQYDAYNNPTTLQYADGSIVTQIFGYVGSGFDTTGTKRRLQAIVDQLGNRTSYVQNPLKNAHPFRFKARSDSARKRAGIPVKRAHPLPA